MSDFTFSEHGEDILIHRLLLWKEHGFYLDCGAYHARNMSLTARLRNFGWTGLNVDIDSHVVARLKKDIPSSKTICVAIGDKEGSANFYRYGDPVINTIDAKQHAHLQAIESAGELFTKFEGVELVRTSSLERVISDEKIKDNTIDFLNLDIEGVELIALEGFPWATQSPTVVSVEIHRLNLHAAFDHPLVRFMSLKGYVLQSYVFHTAIFVKSNFDTELCHKVSAIGL